jgi:hypothetical protein
MNVWKVDGCCAILETNHDLVDSCTLRPLAVLTQFGVSKRIYESGTIEGSVFLDKKILFL